MRTDDPSYLREQQYKDTVNLNARIAIHARFSTNRYGWQRWVFDQLRLPAECCLLELGAGPGHLWRDNLHRLPPAWRVTVTDFSAGMVQAARRNLQDGRFAFAVADAVHIPFADAVFDAVVANHMLYHVPDRRRALAEITRVLRSGGKLYAATVGANHMRELTELLHRFDPQVAWTGIGLAGAYASFSLENGRQQLETWFANVTLHRYEDALLVTEVASLVDYILSTGVKVSPQQQQELTDFLAHEMATSGVIGIRKDSGLFEATRMP